MGSFKLGGMTFGSIFKKPETTRYPYEKKPVPEGLKGHIENDVENCILCGMCQRTCPTDAISVDKAARTWTINPFRCIQCGSCARACPKKCLSMLPTYTPVSTAPYSTTLDVPDQKAARTSESGSAQKDPEAASKDPQE